MKVAHFDPAGGATLKESVEHARTLENTGKLKDAEKLYRTMLKGKSPSELVFSRLMIVLRKQKEYDEEMKVIDRAIAVFETSKSVSRHSSNRKVHQLSLSLGKSMGLLNKSGKSLFDPEPIATWKRRKILLAKKIK